MIRLYNRHYRMYFKRRNKQHVELVADREKARVFGSVEEASEYAKTLWFSNVKLTEWVIAVQSLHAELFSEVPAETKTRENAS